MRKASVVLREAISEMAALLAAAFTSGITIQPLSRGAFVRGVTATAAIAAQSPALAAEFVAKRATDVSQIVGSGGLSAYNELKLASALKELAGAPASADIKASVDMITSALRLINDNKVPDVSEISQATDSLKSLVLTDDLQTQVASIAGKIAGIRSAISKTDANAAAIAAVALSDELTEFCYAYDGAEKPLAELRNGVPAVYDRDRKSIELPVSGKGL